MTNIKMKALTECFLCNFNGKLDAFNIENFSFVAIATLHGPLSFLYHFSHSANKTSVPVLIWQMNLKKKEMKEWR